MNISLVFLLFQSLLIAFASAGYSKFCLHAQRGGKGVCGWALADKLMNVCKLHDRRHKRSISNKDEMMLEKLDSFLYDAPLKSATEARSLIKSYERAKLFRSSASDDLALGQNIICECCYHKCSIEELYEYC